MDVWESRSNKAYSELSGHKIPEGHSELPLEAENYRDIGMIGLAQDETFSILPVQSVATQ